jgi:hypothetical protein
MLTFTDHCIAQGQKGAAREEDWLLTWNLISHIPMSSDPLKTLSKGKEVKPHPGSISPSLVASAKSVQVATRGGPATQFCTEDKQSHMKTSKARSESIDHFMEKPHF